MNATTESGPTQDGPNEPGPLPPDDPRPPQPPPPVKWLRRDPNSALAGVATGFANYLGLTPIVVQIAFVVLTAFSGFGILAYIACWLLIPQVSDPEVRPVTITSNTSRAIIGVLFAIGAASTTLTLGPNTFEITLLPLILVAAGFFLLNQRDQGASPVGASGHSPGPFQTPNTAYATAPPAPGAQAPGAQSQSTPSHWADVDVAPAMPNPPEPPGPPVTSVTLALVAVVIGLLVTIGQFGVTMPAAAVFGAALAVLGGGLIYGAFNGRPRGLVPIGLLLAMGLAVAPAVDAFSDGGTGSRDYAPVTQADVQDTYDLGAGPLELDLRRVEFTEDQTITVSVGAGYAEIWLPNDVNANVEADASAGYVEVFGRENAGLFASASDSRTATSDNQPTVTVIVEVTFGYAEVRRG